MLNIPVDKAKHFVAGFVIACLGAWLLNPIAGVCLAIFAGGVKEFVWDAWLKKGTKNKYDLYATALGAVPMLIGYGVWRLMEMYL